MPTYKPVFREDFQNIAPLIREDNTGVLKPNPFLVHSLPFFFTFDEIANSSNVQVPPNGTIKRIMSTDKSGIIDLRRICGTALDPNYLIYIYDNEYQRYLSNRPIHAQTIVGVADDPFLLPIPLILHQTQSLVLELTDLSGNINIVQIVFTGRRYYFDAKREVFDKASIATKISRPYFYTTDDSVALQVSNNIQSAFLTIVNDADFYLHQINAKYDDNFKIKITNLSNGLSFQNGWIAASSFSGQARDYAEFEPMLLQRRTQLKIEFINESLNINNIYLTFVGSHYYYQR